MRLTFACCGVGDLDLLCRLTGCFPVSFLFFRLLVVVGCSSDDDDVEAEMATTSAVTSTVGASSMTSGRCGVSITTGRNIGWCRGDPQFAAVDHFDGVAEIPKTKKKEEKNMMCRMT